MFNNEKQFEDFIISLPLDDNVNHQHKEQLEKLLLEKYVPAAEKQKQPHYLWSSIMKNRITHIAAAAVLLIAIGLFWPSTGTNTVNPLHILENVCKAENAFFNSAGITHIITEIKVLPLPEKYRKESVLTPDVDVKKLSGPDLWFNHNWMPTPSLKSDGEFRMNQLKLARDTAEAYTITDQAWYDPTTGFFKRVMEKDGKIIMGNAWDGIDVYEAFSENGKIRRIKEPTKDSFRAPLTPAEFLGFTAGICQSVKGGEGEFNFKQIGEDTMEDGREVNLFRSGFEDLNGNVHTYWLFKVEADTDCLAELEFYIADNKHISIKRKLTEKIDNYSDSWTLADADTENAADSSVSMNSDMYVDNVTVKHMAEKAAYPTYVFNKKPEWCTERKIYDVVDPPSPGHRMFIIDYFNKNDNKHVMLIQSKSYNGMFVQFLKDDVDRTSAYLSSGDTHYIYHGGPQEKWWTKVVLDSCSITPEEDRQGFLIWTGSETIPALVINGATTQEELQEILDSLVTSEEYLKTTND